MIVVTDIDGTVANTQHRDYLRQAKLYEAYNKASVDDEPYQNVVTTLQVLSSDCVVIACTGRPEQHRAITESWLIENGVPVEHVLMRPYGNRQSDSVIKVEVLERWLKENGYEKDQVLCILEDRDTVVDAWREAGFNCWQVRIGDY